MEVIAGGQPQQLHILPYPHAITNLTQLICAVWVRWYALVHVTSEPETGAVTVSCFKHKHLLVVSYSQLLT